MRNITTPLLLIVIAFLFVIVIGLLIQCKLLTDNTTRTQIDCNQEITTLKEKNSELEDQIFQAVSRASINKEKP